MIGRKAVDPTEEALGIKIRESPNPLQILIHEYEHRLDNIIKEEEWDAIRKINDPEINNLFIELDKLTQERDNILEVLGEEGPESARLGGQLLPTALAMADKKRTIKQVLYEEYYQSRTLEQMNNDLVIDARKRIVNNPKYYEKITSYMESFSGDSIKRILDRMLLEKYNIDSDEYLKNLLEMSDADLEYSKREEGISDLYFVLVGNLLTDPTKDVGFRESEKKLLGEIYSLLSKGPYVFTHSRSDDYDKGQSILNFYNVIQSTPSLRPIKNHLDQIARNEGLTYIYSMRNYNPKFEDATRGEYSELSATYREQPIKTRRRLLNSANPLIRETYTKLTQIAFDSGKMDINEYIAIMGERYCKQSDCSDKLCVEYKLSCCIEHPNSPNC